MAHSKYQLLLPTGRHGHGPEAHGPGDSANDQVRTPLTLLLERRSLLLGVAVGFVVEGLALIWHFVVVREHAHAEADVIESVVALLLWSLITTAAPFLVLDHLRGLLLEASDDIKTIRQRLTCMERRFGAGALLGICIASAGIDAATGLENHFRFSVLIAIATFLACVAMPRLYRTLTGRGENIDLLQSERRRSKMMSYVDPEQLRSMELTPGTLLIEEL